MTTQFASQLRLALQNTLHWGLRTSAWTIASIAIASPAFAQLRTGRDTDRDFYPSESVPSSLPKAAAKNRSSDVVQASSEEVVYEAEPEVIKPKRTPKAATNQPARVTKKATATSNQKVSVATHRGKSDSRVVQAACKNCQAGIPHSHGPIATHDESESVIAQEVDEVGLSETMYDPNSMQFSSCDTCGPSCDSSCGPMGGGIVLCTMPDSLLSRVLLRTHLRIEAATFWPEGQNLPQLVTTRRPASDPATDGLIGRSDTVTLFGGTEMLGRGTQGLRGEIGLFFDDCSTAGVLFRFFDAGSTTESYSSTPTSEAVVMRPFFSVSNNAQATIAVNYPGSTSGSLNAAISSETYGGDLLFRRVIGRDPGGRLELLAGYQTARLNDSLFINSTTTALTNTPAPAGTVSQLSDRFETINRFNGAALGLSGMMREACWSLSGMFKLGFGNLERDVLIDGSSSIVVPGNPPSTSNTSNGLLARSTNNGLYNSSTFVFVPETNLTLGYRFTRGLEATIGYSYLGLPKVARVADQLDPNLAVNLSNPPSGGARPSFALHETNFSLHSLNYGLQWRY